MTTGAEPPGGYAPEDLSGAYPPVDEPVSQTAYALVQPTAVAAYDGRLLAVNSRFDARDEGRRPDLPFTVSDIPIPDGAAPASAGSSASASGGRCPCRIWVVSPLARSWSWPP